jgi:hypothetical protein
VEITFIVIALHINFPEICQKLMEKPKFTDWKIADLTEQWRLVGVAGDLAKKLETYGEYFDEDWEQVVYCLCQTNSWLETKAVAVSKLLNCLRVALVRQAGQKPAPEKWELDDGDVERLEGILEDIRVVTVIETNSIAPPDNSKIKQDAVTRFCKNIHKGLIAKEITFVKDVRDEFYAKRPRDSGGDRQYELTLIKSNTYELTDAIESYLYWYKNDNRLWIYATFTPSQRNKKKILGFLEKNHGPTILESGDCTCGILLSENFTKEHFATASPDAYLDAIDGFYKWLQSALEKLRAV